MSGKVLILPVGPITFVLRGKIPAPLKASLLPFERHLGIVLDLAFETAVTRTAKKATPIDVLGIWRMDRVGSRTVFDIFHREWSSERPALSAVIDGLKGVVKVHPDADPEAVSHLGLNVLLQVLATEFLARWGGLLLHASAVREGEWVTLFCGTSGTGKTTAALHCAPRAQRICEDRTAVWINRGSRVLAMSTPFQSRGTGLTGRGHPRAIYLLEQASEIEVVPLSKLSAAAGLLGVSFSPFWDRRLIECAMSASTEIARRVRVQRLRLRNDADFVPLALGGANAST